MSRIPRIRAMGVAMLAAITVVLGLSVMPASAAVVAPTAVQATSKPTVTAGVDGQTAGNITMTIPATATADTLTIAIDDSDGSPNCTGGATDAIVFSSTPTVSATVTSGTTPTFSVTPSTSAICTAAGVSKADILTITFSAPAPNPATLTISGIKYDVKSAVSIGDVQVMVNGATVPSASNATVVTVVASANNPPKAIAPSTGAPGAAVSNIVFAEQGTNSISATVCAVLSGNTGGPNGANFDLTNTTAAPAPTVTASPSSADVVSGVVVSGGQIQFTVTQGSAGATKSTFTIAGIRLDTGTATGPVFVTLTNCGGGVLSNTTIVTSVNSANRLGGADRFATAEIIAEADGPDCDAIIARGDLFPDALAGNYLSGSTVTNFYAPILLTNTDSLPPATVNALRNLGVKNVFILGKEQAVSKAVADALAAQASTAGPAGPAGACGTGTSAGNLTVERIGGTDRYETAKLISERPGLGGAGTLDVDGNTTTTPVKTAILATGENFPDALTGGPMAYIGTTGPNGDGMGYPLLLTNSGALNSNASAALVDMGIKQVLILGGTTAVSSAVESAVKSLNGGINTIRLAGADRFGTAVAIATFERASAAATGAAGSATGPGLDWAFTGDNPDHANLARGDKFPDSLTGGPHAGDEQAPILLAENPSTLAAPTATYLKQEGTRTDGGAISTLDIFGGPDAVSQAVVTAAQNALTGA